MNIKKYRKNQAGFTLIELVIVLTIIGVILAIAVPGFTKTIESSKLQADKATARVIGTAAQVALLDDVKDITIEKLVADGYLEKTPTPQKKGVGKFLLKIKNEKIFVSYENGTETLYPDD